jgi:nucleoside-diphosphate kinase
MAIERTLVLLKPDAIRRGLTGQIISRFETAGLKITAMRLVNHPDEQLIVDHYRSTPEWLDGVGRKTLKSYREKNLDIKTGFNTEDPMEIGKIVKSRLIRYMTGGSIIAMVIEGNNGIRKVRDMAGYTIPSEAAPGTIRGDFSSDSPDLATALDRSVENLVHASGTFEEALYEINLWFPG